MNITALAIGLRDGKNDGHCKDTLFDLEDSMPERIDPKDKINWEQERTVTHLPYLDADKRTSVLISTENLSELKSIVSSWQIEDITQQVKQQKIVFADTLAETMSHSGPDDGHYQVRIHSKDIPHTINGILNRMTDQNPERRILTDQQIDAFKERLTRIKTFITSCKEPFSVRDLVFAVDPFAKLFFDKIQKSAEASKKKDATKASGGLKKSTAECTRDSQGPFHLIGFALPAEFQC